MPPPWKLFQCVAAMPQHRLHQKPYAPLFDGALKKKKAIGDGSVTVPDEKEEKHDLGWTRQETEDKSILPRVYAGIV